MAREATARTNEFKDTSNPYAKNAPMNNRENEQKLVQYVTERLEIAQAVRGPFVQRLRDIDKQITGFVKLDDNDRKRHRDNLAGKAPKPVKHNLPLTQSQIDEAATFLLSVFAPEGDLFEAISDTSKQSLANGLALYANQQGQRVQYYRHLSRGLSDILKYNLGGWFINWEQDSGVRFSTTADKQVKKEAGVVWEGNRMTALDMYNFLWDPTIHPVDLANKGEFFATVELCSRFKIRKYGREKRLFNIERYITEKDRNKFTPDGTVTYYEATPQVRHDTEDNTGTANWTSIFSGVSGTGPISGAEVVHFVTWLVPKEFGLSSANELQLWYIALVNGDRIGYHAQLEDSHGMLPVAISSPIEDSLGIDQRSYAEQLLPLQNFASFLLNTHQDATRKALYGITFYNPNIFPGLDKKEDELIAAKIPMRTTSMDRDINKAVIQFTDAPDTKDNIQQIGLISDLMQKILPTDQLRQVAGLERATTYQAAATVQASNRRNYKIARVIASQAITTLKLLMMYNIYGNLQTFEYTNEEGQRVEANIADVVDKQIELDIGSGLKGIDRLIIVQTIQNILQYVLQSQDAVARIDILKLLNYFTSLAGDRTNLTQFARQEPVTDEAGNPLAQTGGA